MFCSLKLKFGNRPSVEVCPGAFARAHSRGHTYYDNMVSEMKKGAANGSSNKFAKHCGISPSAVKDLMKNSSLGKTLTTSQFTAAALPQTVLALVTAAWMKEFFRLTGKRITRSNLLLLLTGR